MKYILTFLLLCAFPLRAANVTVSADVNTLLTGANFAAVRTSLALVPGTNIQAYDADLANIAAISTATFGRSLLALTDAPSAQVLLELGDVALLDDISLVTNSAGNEVRVDGEAMELRNSGGVVYNWNTGTFSSSLIFNGVSRFVGPVESPFSSISGTTMNLAKYAEVISVTGNVTVSFTGTPATGQIYKLKIIADGTARTVTIPSSFSLNRTAAITSVVVPANGTTVLIFERESARWLVYGDPVGTTGSGDYVLVTGATLAPALVTPTAMTLPTTAGVAALATAGAVSLNSTDKQIGIYNGTKEVALPLTRDFAISFDPKAVCDGAVDRLFLMKVTAPKGITITSWSLSYEADPTTEADLDLKRATAFIGVGSAAVMDVLDTTAGVASESTAANVNSGAVIAAGQCLYLEFGTAYSETGHQMIFQFSYETEED